jgi:hypothetical protein
VGLELQGTCAEIPCAHFTPRYLPRQYPQGIYPKVIQPDHWGMTKNQIEEARRLWVAKLVETECNGVKADFARKIGKDASYVARMLYEPEKDGAKAIGEDMMRAIMAAFPNAKPPPGEAATPLFTPERRSDDDVTAIQIALESLLVAVLKTTQGAASVFLADVDSIALRRKFSTKHGMLSTLVRIAESVHRNEAAEASAPRRGDSARRKKP